MNFKDIVKNWGLGIAKIIGAIGSYLKFTAVAPADYIAKKQHEDNLNKIKEKCQNMDSHVCRHPELK